MFLLMAHAFFKALLFLGAGIVIHALGGEQDIRKMGGLRKLMPKTWWAMLIGGLALAGMPPLSGFFAKDSILAATLGREDWFGYVLFAAGIVGDLLHRPVHLPDAVRRLRRRAVRVRAGASAAREPTTAWWTGRWG